MSRSLSTTRELVLSLAGLAVVLFIALGGVRRLFGLELDPESLRAFVAGLGLWGPVAYVGLVMLRIPLGLPSAVLLIGGGLVFGGLAGTLYGAIGLVLSAHALFFGARWLGTRAVEARLPPRLRPVLELVGAPAGAAFVGIGTAYPVGPVSLYHLVSGVSGMALGVFALAVTLGSGVRSAAFTYFGSGLVAAEGEQLLLASLGLAAIVLVPLAFPGPRAWLRHALRDPADNPSNEPRGDR